MDWGIWTEDKKSSYNNWDAISRCTVEVGIFGSIFYYAPQRMWQLLRFLLWYNQPRSSSCKLCVVFHNFCIIDIKITDWFNVYPLEMLYSSSLLKGIAESLFSFYVKIKNHNQQLMKMLNY